MKDFYLRAMRLAAPILFVVALVVFVVTIAAALLQFFEFREQYRGQPIAPWVHVSFAMLSALQNAALPLFGAAALWRGDRWFALENGK